MLNVICIRDIGALASALTGRIDEVTKVSTKLAVTLKIGLIGVMAFWSYDAHPSTGVLIRRDGSGLETSFVSAFSRSSRGASCNEHDGHEYDLEHVGLGQCSDAVWSKGNA